MNKFTVKNDTGFAIIFREGNAGIFRDFTTIPAGGKYSLRHDTNATYREFEFRPSRDSSSSQLKSCAILSSDDCLEWSELRIYLDDRDKALRWMGTVPRKFSKNEPAFASAKDEISPKFDAALRSCIGLKKLLKAVRICRNQCNHLVQTYEEGIQKMTHLYSQVADSDVQIMRYFRDQRLTQLDNSLDRLEYIVCDMKDLLGACAKELGWIALVVSMPMPPVKKDMEVCSDFDLLVRELKWNLDLIEYLIGHPARDVKLEWSPTVRRYVLKRSDGSRNVVAEEKAADQTKRDTCEGVLRSLARIDREELQSGLEDGSIFIPNSIRGWLARRFFGLGQKNLNVTVFERCKVKMVQDLQSHLVDPELLRLACFRIDHLDLKPNIEIPLGEGSFKKTYEGKWYGQTVAIATIRMDGWECLNSKTPFVILLDEVMQLLRLQHPKVVSFFGWAETNDAPTPIKKPGDDGDECIQGGYIVTEKMERDLEKLIRVRMGATTKDGGGPFSTSVELDILLQIVEAMLHVQKHGVMHRDLKPRNFLVNSRSAPRPGADIYYNVKLIDFGSSKLYLGENENTLNMGTTTYGAPEMQKGKEREADRGKYGPSVDVFSFAMTCYQVITGKKPFQGKDASAEIKSGERPEFPQTVLFGLKELTEECWAEDPRKRPSFEKIQETLWTIKMKLAVP